MATLAHTAALLAAELAAVMPDRIVAYIGPGAGLGAILFTIALGLGVLLLLMGLVWYPLKRLYKSRSGGLAGGRRPDGPA